MNNMTQKMPIEKTELASSPYEVLINPYEPSNPYDNTSPIAIPPAPPRVHKSHINWRTITLVLLLLLGLPSGIGLGYYIGNTSGWHSGYQANTNSGEAAGYSKGRSAGYAQGVSDGTNSGYQNGFAKGKLDGYNSGYTKGKTDGYNSGHNAGVTDGSIQSRLALYSFLNGDNTSTGTPCKVANITDSAGNSDYRYMRAEKNSDGTIDYYCLTQ